MGDLEEHLDKFCGSKFWDWDLTWKTEDPDLTPCFQKTAALWIACGFLWFFLPLQAYYIISSKNRDIPWTCLSVSKCVMNVMLLVTQVGDIWHAIDRRGYEEVFLVDLFAPAIRFLTLTLALILLLMNKRRGQHTSGVMFLFWLLMAVTGAVMYRTHLKQIAKEEVDDMFYFVTYMVYYPLVIGMLLLNCWAEPEPRIMPVIVQKFDTPCPEERASFLSCLGFFWFDRMAWRGYRKSLETKDLWDLNTEDKSRTVVTEFDRHWEKTLSNAGIIASPPPDMKASFSKNSRNVDLGPSKRTVRKPVSVVSAMWKAFGGVFIFGVILKIIADTLVFIGPQILRLLIDFVENGGEVWKGYFYAILLLVSSVSQSVITAQYSHRMYVTGMKIRSALISVIYRKAMKVSNASRKESTVGEIVNLMAVDAQRFMDVGLYLSMAWSTGYQIILAMYFLWAILGPSVLAGLAVMVFMIPFNTVVGNEVKKLQTAQMKCKDQRVKLMNEVLSGMKVLKLYAWEPSFQDQLTSIRAQEVALLRKSAFLNAALAFAWNSAPFLVALASFTTFVLVDEANVLDASTAFVSLTLFNIMRTPLNFLPMMVVYLVQAAVSVKRINKFLNSEDLDEDAVSHDPEEHEAILVENGTFTWSAEDPVVLRNVSMRVKEKSLVAVVGSVGSGKSSLLGAILGEMERLSGRINCKGRVAYVSQQAWIQNATLQDNILFGKSLDPGQYNKVVDACALRPDFEMLPGGDKTEIGEKGINVSGGQKQRVSLARAVYNDADLYLLDDPLSAVDSHVGKHIFEKVIGPQGMLKYKTRVLVTHGITYLPQMDQIVVLKDGEVSEVGTYQELLDKKGAFADFLLQHLTKTEDLEEADPELGQIKEALVSAVGAEEFQRQLSRQKSIVSDSLASDSCSGDGYLSRQISKVANESFEKSLKRRRSSAVSSEGKSEKNGGPHSPPETKPKVGEKLIEAEKSQTGGVKLAVYIYYFKAMGTAMVLGTVLMHVTQQAFSISGNIWLSEWSNVSPNISHDPSERDKFLAVYGALGLGQALGAGSHDILMYLGCAMCSNVLHNIMLGNVLRSPMSFFDTTPLGRILNRFSKDIDVIDNMIPLMMSYALWCIFEVIATITVITYSTPVFVLAIIPIGIIYYFIQRFYICTSRQLKRLESMSRSPIYSHFSESVSGAFTIRAFRQEERFVLESEEKVDANQICYYPSIASNRWLAVRLEAVGNLIIFFAAVFAVIGRESLSPGIVGLSISYSLQVTIMLNWMVRTTCEIETNIVAVERIKEYAETPQEAPWERNDSQVPESWPMEGRVEFDNYATRYREGLDLVLKGISCVVEGGEKVGIVGRTGAGKSSLTLALLRIIEGAGGRILIDGEEIGRLGLHQVRGRLTIIPQDPVLFSGTLRLNLDPFNTYTDQQVWEALQHAHLKAYVKSLNAGLQHEVTEGGENMSVGQRQLVCLARALLRKTTVLILDEATAAVDLETDDLIQQTIRKEFADCTVLTIAHRLNTIMDNDRVMVLDKGIIVEFDSPASLLQKRKSVFYGMAKDAGLVQ